jgi:hypothetical protein
MAIEKELRVTEIKKIAAGFRLLIESRQAEFIKSGRLYTYTDLLAGTKYEKIVKVVRKEGVTIIKAPTSHGIYEWEYRDLVVADSDRSATLTEKQTGIGF